MDFSPVTLSWGYSQAETAPEKPKNFEKMQKFAQVLSEGLLSLRVDFYEVNGQVYVGELTFFDGSGFDRIEPVQWDETMGSWVQLPM